MMKTAGPVSDISPAFGNPARSEMTSVGFAAPIHMGCAFIASGNANIT
jgi:hypothetical protein